jgi:DNA primase
LRLSASLNASLEAAALKYHAEVAQVLPYLAARGIGPEAADTFRLGYVATPDVGHNQFIGRMSIPFLTPSGTVDLRFRSVDESTPKYLSRAGANSHLFGVNAFQTDSDVIVITEGEMDCIIVNQCGVPAVGLSGANVWKPFYARLFGDYRKVVALVDGDSAGRDLGKTLSRELDNAVVVEMPEGKDVTDYYLAEGSEGLLRYAGLD